MAGIQLLCSHKFPKIHWQVLEPNRFGSANELAFNRGQRRGHTVAVEFEAGEPSRRARWFVLPAWPLSVEHQRGTALAEHEKARKMCVPSRRVIFCAGVSTTMQH